MQISRLLTFSSRVRVHFSLRRFAPNIQFFLDTCSAIYSTLAPKRKRQEAEASSMFSSSGSRSSGSKASKRGAADEGKLAAIQSLFQKYADPGDEYLYSSTVVVLFIIYFVFLDEVDCISVEEAGGQLFEDLGIDGGSDAKAIVLLWRLGAKRKNADKPMTITAEVFAQRMLQLNATSLPSLKAILPSFDPGFLENDEYVDFLSFAFDLNRDVPRKTLMRDTVLDLLPIVLTKERAPHLDLFMQFLRENEAVKDITLDQWKTFMRFNQQVPLDCKGYNADDGAWPLLFDDYVDWRANSSSCSNSHHAKKK